MSFTYFITNRVHILKIRAFLIINTVLASAFGAALILVPVKLLGFYGIVPIEERLFQARIFAIPFFGYAMITWLAKNIREPEAMSAIMLGLVRCNTVAFCVLLAGQVSGVLNQLGWVNTALAFFLGLGCVYFKSGLFKTPISKRRPVLNLNRG